MEIYKFSVSIVVLFTAKTKTYMPKSYFSKEFSEKFIVKQNRLTQYVYYHHTAQSKVQITRE